MTTMDFFGHQERAQRSTRRLVVLFVLAVVAIVVSIYVAARLLLLIADDGSSRDLLRWDLFAAVAAVTLTVVGSASLFKTAQLRSGGGVKVAALLGGTLVSPESKDPGHRRLQNVVEEMAIASGLPVPQIFVLEHESGINAFAAGWAPDDAAIAVTRGCLDQLDRDELQGVIAHEFSHVFHGDMRLNIRLMGVLFGIVCIATIGRIVVHAVGRGAGRRSSRGKGGAAGVVLFGLALIVIGWLGVLFARLIQAAVSRHREFLADASAVQYTRNPRGIGLALAKIGGLGGRLQSASAESASHMLFADGVSRFFGGAFATHPPIEERVERVLPGFRRQLASAGDAVAAARTVEAPPVPAGAAGFAGAAATAGAARPARPGDLVGAVGAPRAADVAAARELLAELPLELSVSAHDARRAPALVAALLLDRDGAVRERQLAPLRDRDAGAAHDAAALHALTARLGADRRLPLLELAMPALRALPAAERERVRVDARALAQADGRLAPFEAALLLLLEHHVRSDRRRSPQGRPASLLQHAESVTVVLSVLARAGARDDEALAAAAFARGQKPLGAAAAAAMLPAAQCDFAAFERAVAALQRVSPLGKRNLLAACAQAAAADGTLTASEADLLRALAAVWDCPMPIGDGAPSDSTSLAQTGFPR